MHRTFVVSSLIIASLPAQVVTSTITALTPITAQIFAGGQTTQATQPAGILPPTGSVEAVAIVGSSELSASMHWFTGAGSRSSQRVALAHQTDTVAVSPATVSVAPHEVLVHFSATASVPIQLELRRWSGLSVGAPLPQVSIDFGNDGIIDWIDLPVLMPQFSSVTIGPAGYDVRVIMTSTVPGPGFSATSLDLIAHANSDLDVALEVAGCALGASASLHQSAPTAVFADRGLDLRMQSGFVPGVAVLGLDLQPVLLPSMFGSACLLTPSRDVVLTLPINSSWTLHLPLPASVRPVTLRSQGVGLTPTGLVTTDAYRVRVF